MNLVPLFGYANTGIPADAAANADYQTKMLSNLETMRANERRRIDRQRMEAARAGEMEPVAGPEDLAAGTPSQMVGMPTAAPVAMPTGTFTSVPDAQAAQYIARNVTPAVTPNQSDAESKRLASKAPRKPGILEQVAAVTTMPGALAVGPSQYMTDADRYAELRKLNPATSAGGNESPAEAKRLLSKPVPSATAAPAVDAKSAIERVLGREGGFVNDPTDRGGATNFGISSKSYPGLDVSKLTKDQAAGIYKRDYWDAINADTLPEGIREMAFDAAVNQGVPWTKQALAASGGDPAKFLQMRRDRYQSIVAADPAQGKFLQGWMNRLNDFGQAQQTAAAPAQAPTAGMPTQAAAPAAPEMAFTPEQVTRVAAAAQQDLRIKQLQLAEINRRLQYAPDLQTATSLRNQANEIRFGAVQAQLTNATAQAMGGNEQAMAQLANAARVQYAQTPQGFVAVALGQDGQYRATTPPMPRERFINTLYSEATGAAQKAREAQAAAQAKATGEIAVQRAKSEGDVLKVRAEAQAALQKLIVENQLQGDDVQGIEFDPLGTRPPMMRTKQGVFLLQPAQEVNGMQTEAKWVPIPS